MAFLDRFQCYLEGSSFQKSTDNQILKDFFGKLNLSRLEARWLETLGNFVVFPINVKQGKIQVLGDVLSRAPHAGVNDVDIPFIYFDDDFSDLEEYQLFRPIVRAMKDEWPTDQRQSSRLRNCFTFSRRNGRDSHIKENLASHEIVYPTFSGSLITHNLQILSSSKRLCLGLIIYIGDIR